MRPLVRQPATVRERGHAPGVRAAGASVRDVVSVSVYLTDVDDWAAMNVVYTQFFASPYPSRTAVGAELRDILVEISAVAYVGGS